jgi:hypothetical protein
MNGANSNTSGDDVVDLDYNKKGVSDRVADATMEEITRRLVATIKRSEQGSVIFSPAEPSDKTKGWWQTDPQTGIPIGEVKRYDTEQAKWVSSAPSTSYKPPREKLLTRVVAAGSSTIEIAVDMATENYAVMPVFRSAVAPGEYPNAMGWSITEKTASTVKFDFKGIPTGGLTLELYCRALEP